MKFLCDKCKTRYSIGDDRVRGKILKIRCKNCANVITVREGMGEAEGAAAPAPAAAASASLVPAAAQGALGAAFASQLTKPPPALEEEWYVSIDGNQEGPYSLSQAQKWVGSKPFEAELHCWSEGFDDWLPVDKVSHFRNLRKKPDARRAPTMPPPIPKPPEKPLFAATMASLEKAATQPKPAAVAPVLPSLKPAAPLQAKANGTGVSQAMPKSAGAAALAQAFKQDDGVDQMTAVEAPAFNDDLPTTAEPLASTKRASAAMPAMKVPEPSALGARPPVKPIMDDEDDNLEIGEVSRVVKLADIAAMGRSKPATVQPANRPSQPALAIAARTGLTGAHPKLATGLTGSHARLSPSELGMNVDPSLASALTDPGAPMPDESVVAKSFAARHRRGMVALIAVSAALVIGVVVAVVFVLSGGNEDLPVGLGGTRQGIDTSRPEDIVRRALPPAPNDTGSGSGATHRPRYTGNRMTTGQNPQPEEPDTGPGSHLDPTEIEAMAAKYGEGTKRCYMRAQKGALGLEIADTKKIDVTLTVQKDGTVSDVQLSKHANNEFGQCLIARIKGWKFRESKGGTFRIALAFSAS